MADAPSDRSTLYRKLRRIVTAASLALAFTQLSPGQASRRGTVDKGPRALALIELAANGKAHLIPITIMYDGRFYDAGAYKAAPVPMALEGGTVYEAVRSGVSQGLFTVTGAARAGSNWIGEGTWKSAEQLAAAAAKKEVLQAKPPEPESDRPPVLRRSGSEKSNPPETAKPAPAPTASTPTPAPAAPAATAPPEQEDPNRPVLKRGKPSAEAQPPAKSVASSMVPTASAKPANPAAKSGSIQLIPAISDAGGPEPSSYAFSTKAEEEQQFRKKILALAGDEVRARDRQLASETIAASAPTRTTITRQQPTFENTQLRIFDLSSSNEPVLVLTTSARLQQHPEREYFVTLVAREDLNGDLHKAFSSVTDSQHLDVLSCMELIDAVDTDGDGRGELLFRQTSDAGRAFSIYRVIGDQLYPLFEGTPQ